MILLSRIEILLLKGLFKREKIIFYKKHLKHRKIMYLTHFFSTSLFTKFFKNGAILINHGSFFQGKDFLQFDRFQFLKIEQLLSNSTIFL